MQLEMSINRYHLLLVLVLVLIVILFLFLFLFLFLALLLLLLLLLLLIPGRGLRIAHSQLGAIYPIGDWGFLSQLEHSKRTNPQSGKISPIGDFKYPIGYSFLLVL